MASRGPVRMQDLIIVVPFGTVVRLPVSPAVTCRLEITFGMFGYRV
jgi:hypothetical protein